MTYYPHAPAQQDKTAAHSASPRPCSDPPTAWVLHSPFSWTPSCPLPPAPATCHLPSASNCRSSSGLGLGPMSHSAWVSSSAPGALDAGRIRQTDRSAPPAVTSPLSSRPARPTTHFSTWTSLWKLGTTRLHEALHSPPSPSLFRPLPPFGNGTAASSAVLANI